MSVPSAIELAKTPFLMASALGAAAAGGSHATIDFNRPCCRAESRWRHPFKSETDNMKALNLVAPQQDFDIGALYSGAYLKADDLAGQTYSATISGVERVEIPETDGSIRPKAAIALHGWPTKLLLNKTNFEALAAAYGRQSAGWIGKPLEVFPDSTLFGGRTVACIRVRVPRPAAPPTAIPGAVAAPAVPASPASAPAAASPAASAMPPLMTAADFENDVAY
jgi:hypothetical protein